MNINELKEYPPADENWSDEKKEEYNILIKQLNAIHEFGDIVTRWANNPEVLRKREEYLRLKAEGKL